MTPGLHWSNSLLYSSVRSTVSVNIYITFYNPHPHHPSSPNKSRCFTSRCPNKFSSSFHSNTYVMKWRGWVSRYSTRLLSNWTRSNIIVIWRENISNVKVEVSKKYSSYFFPNKNTHISINIRVQTS